MSDKDILSQEEIDALLTGVGSGDVDTVDEEPEEEGDVRSFDLANQDKIVRGRLPTLEVINEKFARYLRGSLYNMLRYTVEVGAGGVKIVKYSDYVNTLYVPTSITTVRLRPLVGHALIVIDAKLIFRLVDQYFGGSGQHTKIEGRDFTPTETRVVERLLEMIFRDAQEAWKSVIPIQVEYLGTEVNPNLVNVINPNEVVVVNSFRLEIEGAGGEIHISIPYGMLEPYRQVLDNAGQRKEQELDQNWLPKLQRGMLDTEVAINCSIAEKDIKLRDLLNFSVGDVIPVDLPDEHVVSANDNPLFYAKLGESKGSLALEYERACVKD